MADNELSQNDIDALFSGGNESPLPPEQEPRAEENTNTAEAPDAQTATETAVQGNAGAETVPQPVEFSQLPSGQPNNADAKIDFLLDVPVVVAVELGRTDMYIKKVLNLGVGSVVELNKLAGEPVDLLINNRLVARGEVVVINENFGVKIIDIISPAQRIKNLG